MLKSQFVASVNALDEQQWNRLCGGDGYPFIRHEFFAALEKSGATCSESGWQPQHLLVYREQQLVALLPLFIKTHSYGEYVFDWAWADAYHRSGFEYYPKLVSAIPFTPVTGPRLCIADDENEQDIIDFVLAEINAHANAIGASSWHLLFSCKHVSTKFAPQAQQRVGVHFQWRNRGFTSFDDFLATFNSRKRKNLRRERSRVTAQGLTLECHQGTDIDASSWDSFYRFYQMTYAKRSGHSGYLSRQFFELLAQTMADTMVLVLAKHDGDVVAGALNFRDAKHLYGRYWGCIREFECLHFEACYYQGIEYCITHGLQAFDPGVQGEHKIARGFCPTYTYSNHWLQNASFREPVERFLQEEKRGMEKYFSEAENLLPFKQQ